MARGVRTQTFPTRFDADLLRIRKVGVVDACAGGIGRTARSGWHALQESRARASSGRMLVPDQEIRFEITPRNFNLGR